ncbi:MAG: cytochrome C oxidase subunit IV family protein [Betaproteobacteria bacterium]
MKSLDLRTPAWTWIALMILLALTAGSALLPLGMFNAISNFAIAVVKSSLVLVFFMHVLRGGAVIRLVAAAGILWLAFLFALSLVDFLARGY